MKLLLTLIAGIIIGLALPFLLSITLTHKVNYVYACRADEPLLNCHSYKADITHDTMDGSYVTAMYNTDSSAPITFEPISQDDSYEKGCWLGKKTGANKLEYSTCPSSFGEWLILEGPTKKLLK